MDSNLCATAKVSEVQSSFDDEDSALEHLAAEIDRLASRISLILEPASESKESDPVKSNKASEKCELANIIDARKYRIFNLYHQIQDLCDRVQL